MKRTNWLLIAAVLLRFAPDTSWMLPGLWQMLFGLGNLAAQQLLPCAARCVGALFLASGAFCVTAITSASSASRSWQKLSWNLSCFSHR